MTTTVTELQPERAATHHSLIELADWIALAGTLALALLVLFFPLRRAVRFRPGAALRYA